MLRSMITATNTMGQLQQNLDIIGNNLANTGTHGYKAKSASFQELLYQQFNNERVDQAPRQSPGGIRYGVGAMIGQTQMNWKVGGMQTTGRDLDMTLTEPKQYFNITMPSADGVGRTVHSRQGAFYVTPVNDTQTMLVNTDGYPVQNAAGQPIILRDNISSFSVRDGGRLEVLYADGAIEAHDLGITVVNRPDLVEHISATYIGLPANMAVGPDVLVNLQGGARDQIGLQNGALELSNVDTQKEMTELINVQRSYQFNARSITLADQMLGLINSIR